jgi:hypothetical protein
VQFEPLPGTPGLGAGANTDRDGNYDLIAIRGGTVRDMMGVPAGNYKVTVGEPMFPIEMDLPVQGESGNEPEVAIGLPEDPAPRQKKRSAIPAKYNTVETTPLEITVPAEGGVINLELAG